MKFVFINTSRGSETVEITITAKNESDAWVTLHYTVRDADYWTLKRLANPYIVNDDEGRIFQKIV